MNLREQLKRDEGVRSTVYFDTVGIPTIGVGRNLNVGLSPDEVDYLLDNDIKRVSGNLEAYDWYYSQDEVRKAALANMCFNLGLGGLLRFPKMLSCLSLKDYENAALEALNSSWALQVGDRAKRIAEQIRTGVWT